MCGIKTEADVVEFLSEYVTQAYGNHLLWGEVTDCEYDEAQSVWQASFTTRENIWREDYELFANEATIDAVDGYLLRCRRLSKSVSAKDLYSDTLADGIQDST